VFLEVAAVISWEEEAGRTADLMLRVLPMLNSERRSEFGI
jgi:hypothetical protein